MLSKRVFAELLLYSGEGKKSLCAFSALQACLSSPKHGRLVTFHLSVTRFRQHVHKAQQYGVRWIWLKLWIHMTSCVA